MDLDQLRESANIDDRRGGGGGGGGGGVALGGGLGLGGIVLAVLFGLLTGQNPLSLLGLGGGEVQNSQGYQAPSSGGGTNRGLNDADRSFAAKVLRSTEDVWTQIFSGLNRRYTPTTLVLFDSRTNSGCGTAQEASGPFYCPPDKNIYLDPTFFNQLSSTAGQGSVNDFARAYVIAHEVAHHVQDELGILEQTTAIRARSSEAQSNAISVRIELQADCFAGVWAARAARTIGLDQNDIQEGLRAASSVGDDTLQRQAGGRVVPDSFTHGTSSQRANWFSRGVQSGDISRCDTFSATNL